MADERRKLIYEILVEAKQIKQEAGAAQKVMGDLGKTIKGVTAALGVGLSLKGIGDALGEVQKFNEQLKTLGIEGTAATAGLHDVQDIAFTTGQSIKDVAGVYQEAIEATQQLGGSQQDAAKLAEAFTRAAVAEGKSAADAAQQLQTLQFALDANNVKSKEFIGLLKSSETFQTAAQQATGKTTAELVKMAQAGEITREQLAGIVQEFQNIGEATEVGVTLDRVIESAATLGKTFVAAIADASGLSSTLARAVNSGGLKDFLDWVRRAGEMLGGLLRIIFNLVEAIGQFGILLSQIILNPTEIGELFDVFVEQQKENIADLKDSLEAIKRGATGEGRIETPDVALRSSADLAADQAARDALDKAKADEEAAKRAREAERLAREDQREMIREAERAGRERIEAAEEVARQEKLISDYIEETRENTEKWIEAMEAPEIPGLTEQMEEQARLAEEMAGTLTGAFADLFTGGIHNAREFFRQVLQGLAQIAIQQAVIKATSFFKDSGFFQGLAGAFGAAKGAVFKGGSVVPFAQGGVVTAPTVFPMRGGRTGLMGEAGAEAVMPLRRLRDGRLGVGTVAPSVQIVNNTGVAAKATAGMRNDRLSIVLEAAQLGATMAEDRFNRSVRSGYGSAAQAVQGTYGLRRRV
jgi:tape measure domain-containing protein